MKNYQKIALFLSCISLILCLIFVAVTYAKYTTSIGGTADLSIARWNILVNGLAVKNNDDFSSVLEPTFPGDSNVAAAVIAPGAVRIF